MSRVHSVRRAEQVGPTQRKEEGLRERAPLRMTRLEDPGPWVCGATCRAPLCLQSSVLSGWGVSCAPLAPCLGVSSLTHLRTLSSFSEFLHVLCAWQRAGRWEQQRHKTRSQYKCIR